MKTYEQKNYKQKFQKMLINALRIVQSERKPMHHWIRLCQNDFGHPNRGVFVFHDPCIENSFLLLFQQSNIQNKSQKNSK